MQPPTEANKALIILVLRTLGVSQDNVAQMARCRKAVVSETELWFSSGLSYSQAVTFADDQTIRQIAAREFAFCGLTEEGLEKAQRITGDDILRHFRIGDYLASSSKEASGEQGHVQSLAQRAMEAHFQKLFHYGQRLRDRLMVYNLRELTSPANRGEEGALWGGRPDPLMSDPPTDNLEKQVEHEWWSKGPYNARKHFIAKDFQQHLSAHPCWQALEQVENSFQRYRKAGEDFYNGVLDKVSNKFKEKMPDVSESYLNVIAGSLMVDACSGGRLNFLYRQQRQQDNTQEGEATSQFYWCLELYPPDWSIGPEADPEKLTLIAKLHQALRKEVPTVPGMGTLKQAANDARARVAEFQEYLSPDEQLWKLLLAGHCSSCL